MRMLRFSLVLAIVATVLGFMGPAHAAVINVDTTDDELNTDGDCSLREAVDSANNDTSTDDCETGSGADMINLLSGTTTLSVGPAGDNVAATGDLDITSDITIVGVTARQSIIDGGDLDRVFHILSGTVAFSKLTIRNGMDGDGSGIHNNGTLTLTEVAVSGHQADSDGAGIFNNGGTLTLIRSLVSDNVTEDGGGGISSLGGSITIENSTVSGNRAECMGGGIALFGATTLSMNNVTIADNEADSTGPHLDCSDPAVRNGGGIFVGGTSSATLSNSLIGDNRDQSPGTDPKHADCSGPLTSEGYNLIEDTTGCTISGDQTGNITGQDPQVQALADEGGPTDTHQLKNNSPAVDAGNPATPDGTGSACEAVDQRGTNRPRGPRCDIGAFERGAGEQLRCLNKKVTLEGTAGPDTLTGTAKRDVVAAGEGDDVINTLGGNDLVCAGGGNDRARTGGGTDQVIGELGNDRVRSGPAADTVRGNGGRDRLIGGGAPDLLKGGRGRDRLIGGGGDDVCKGGPGKDKIRRC